MTPSPIRLLATGRRARTDRVLLDTSVAIALEGFPVGQAPADFAISALTLAELTMGLVGHRTREVRTRRQRYLRWVEDVAVTLDFDPYCASAYERICAATIQIGRRVRGARSIDLLIAATALAHQLPLYTRNADDLRGLEGLIEIVDLS